MGQNNQQQGGKEKVDICRLEDTRIIYLNGEINDQVAFVFNTLLLKMEQESSTQDISVYINSPGGSVSAGFSMIDTMNLISCDVSTICVGMAASMAAVLLMAGKKGKRKILPHSLVLIHQPMSSYGNRFWQTTEIQIRAKEALRTRDTLYGFMCEATGQPLSRIEADCERDYTLTAKEAMEYGIVDEILDAHGA